MPGPRFLRISDVAAEWSKEINRASSILERDLIEWCSEALTEFEVRDFHDGWIDSALEEWPPVEGVDRHTLVPQGLIQIFCDREDYPMPRFWFATTPPDTRVNKNNVRKTGRPGFKAHNIAIFDRLMSEGKVDLSSKKAAANCVKNNGGKGKHETIEGHLTEVYDQTKNG